MLSKRYLNNSRPLLKLNQTQLKAKHEVEYKLDQKEYHLEEIECPICNSTSEKSRLLAEKDRYGLSYYPRICEKCGLVYVSPRMDQASYNKFYDLEYRRLYLGAGSPSEYYFNRQYGRGREIYEFIRNKAFKDKDLEGISVLEIGCSSGGILNFFKEKGCKVMGVDLDTNYLNYGREKHGLNLLHGNLKNIPFNFKPDVIIYSHVLEHILDLNSELIQLKKITSDNTVIYIEVPGIKNIHRAYNHDILSYFQNAHTFHFSLNSLKNLMTKFDFELLTGDEFIRSIFISGDKAQTEPKNDFQEILQYLEQVEKERFFKQFNLRILFLKLKGFGIQKILKVMRFTGLKKKL